MASRIFKSSSWTAAAVADATNMVNQQFMGVQGGSSTQRVLVQEVQIGGQAVSSAPSSMQVSRDSTVGATLTALTTGESDAPVDPATAALSAPVQTFTQSSTKPQRSASQGLINISLNLYGGLMRWVAAPYKELVISGNTASFGEISLSAFTGSVSGTIGAHIQYEAL